MLKSLLSNWRRPAASFDAIEPEQPFYVIGDIHGRIDLLERLLSRLKDGIQIVCVGDYIDRGEASAEVLRFLHARPDITCLMGNHESMLTSFLANPVRFGPRWLRYGGLQTLASFGISGVTESAPDDILENARDDLAVAMGEDLIEWVETLPLIWRSGNVAVVHAGADPEVPIERQPARALIWGTPDFPTKRRTDGIWLVHGHSIVAHPSASQGEIAIDTGAYATGRLTAAHVIRNGVAFLGT